MSNKMYNIQNLSGFAKSMNLHRKFSKTLAKERDITRGQPSGARL